MYVRSNYNNSEYGKVSNSSVPAQTNKGPFVSVTTWDGDIASKQALDLNGSAYVSINDHDRYAFGTDDFTFEGWVSQDVFTGTYSQAPFYRSK